MTVRMFFNGESFSSALKKWAEEEGWEIQHIAELPSKVQVELGFMFAVPERRMFVVRCARWDGGYKSRVFLMDWHALEEEDTEEYGDYTHVLRVE